MPEDILGFYKGDPPEKEWLGNKDSKFMTSTDGKKYSWNELIKQGYTPNTIIRNWNLDTKPEQKTTMAQPIIGEEQRPIIDNTPKTRSEAFKQARASGEKVFTYDGKQYTTDLAADKPVAIQQSQSQSQIDQPAPYKSSYSKPYENMTEKEIKDYIKNSYSMENPYTTLPFVGTHHTLNDWSDDNLKKMGFGDESFSYGALFNDDYEVITKNGDKPKAVKIPWMNSPYVEDDFELYKQRDKTNQVSDRINAAFYNPSELSLEELKLAAANIDSSYAVSNIFNSPNTLKDIKINLPSLPTYDNIIKDSKNVKNLFKSDTNNIPKETEEKTFSYGNGGLRDDLTGQKNIKPTFRNGGIHNINRNNISEAFDEMMLKPYLNK